MSNAHEKLAILNKFNFERPPVGVKFLLAPPKDIERIDKRLHLCEMLPEAQKGQPFYATKEDITCVGTLYLGMAEQRVFESGLVGPRMKLFKEARANSRLYDVIPRLRKGSAKYVVFAPLPALSFDPDVLIITTSDMTQAEILLRATAYRTGKMWTTKLPPVVACSFVYVYPYVTGEVNYVVAPVGFGKDILPNGTMVISFPFDLVPEVMDNLRDMEATGAWIPDLHKVSRSELKVEVDKIHQEIEEILAG